MFVGNKNDLITSQTFYAAVDNNAVIFDECWKGVCLEAGKILQINLTVVYTGRIYAYNLQAIRRRVQTHTLANKRNILQNNIAPRYRPQAARNWRQIRFRKLANILPGTLRKLINSKMNVERACNKYKLNAAPYTQW